MPILVKNVKGSVLDNFTGNINCFSSIIALVQFEDYINLNGFIAYLQNFKKVESVTQLEKPLSFGLKNQYNLPTTILEISY
jgi:hypothetical protein